MTRNKRPSTTITIRAGKRLLLISAQRPVLFAKDTVASISSHPTYGTVYTVASGEQRGRYTNI